jgi:hypothetical protein
MRRWAALVLASLLVSTASALAGSAPPGPSKIDAQMLVDLDLLSDEGFAAHADARRHEEIERDRELLDDLDWLERDDDSPSETEGARRR